MSAENPAVNEGDEVVALAVRYPDRLECQRIVGRTLPVKRNQYDGSILVDGFEEGTFTVTRWTLPEQPAEPWVPAKGDRVQMPEREWLVSHSGEERVYLLDPDSGERAAIRPEHLTLIEPATPPEPDKRPGQVWEDAQGRRLHYLTVKDDTEPWWTAESPGWHRDDEIARPIKLVLDAPGGEQS